MLIGIDASRANREKKTGVEWYSYHLIEALKKIDTENRYFLYSEGKLKNDLGDLPSKWQSKILKWPPKFLWTQICLSWEMLFKAPDLLFIPSHVIPLIHPKKTITTIHDLGFRRFPQAYSKFQQWYLNWSVKFALKHAFKIIVPSQFTKDELIKIYNAAPEQITVIPLSYNTKTYYPITDQEKITQTLSRYQIKKPYLLYVGRLEEKKNVAFLLDVFKNLSLANNNLSLVLAGGRGYGYEKIQEKIKECDLGDQIVQLDWTGENDLPCLYSGAEIFVFPSLYEGFGIPLLEAMACGTPVVASNIASIPEISGGAALLAKVNNVDDFAQKISEVLENDNLKEILRQKGLARVKNFSWQNCAEKTLNLFC